MVQGDSEGRGPGSSVRQSEQSWSENHVSAKSSFFRRQGIVDCKSVLEIRAPKARMELRWGSAGLYFVTTRGVQDASQGDGFLWCVFSSSFFPADRVCPDHPAIGNQRSARRKHFLDEGPFP